jgi:hypothetical protein
LHPELLSKKHKIIASLKMAENSDEKEIAQYPAGACEPERHALYGY